MGSKLSFKWNLYDIYVCKEYLLCIVYFIVESLTTVDASYFVRNCQSCTVNTFIVNVIRQRYMQTSDKGFFVVLIVISFVLNKCMLLGDTVNPLLLLYALIEVTIS